MRKTRDDREIEKSKIRKEYARHRTCESLPRAYIDVKSAELSELTSYVIQKILLLFCEIEIIYDCIVRFSKRYYIISCCISDCIIRFFEMILFDFNAYQWLYKTFFRSRIIWRQIIVTNSLEIHHWSKLIAVVTVQYAFSKLYCHTSHFSSDCTVRSLEAVLSRLIFLLVFFSLVFIVR